MHTLSSINLGAIHEMLTRSGSDPIVNSFETFFDAFLSQIAGNMVFYLFFSLPVTIVMRSSLLNDTVQD